MNHSSQFGRNAILSVLSTAPEFRKIESNFKFREIEASETVQQPNRPMRSVFFPLSGMLSSVVEMEDGDMAEVCCVGRGGMVNWESLLGQERSRFKHFCQLQGEVASIASRDLMPLATHPAIISYVARASGEFARNAACNSLHHVDERLARWLLIAADKVQSHDLKLTQDFLAIMLGARRATVTIAAGKLQQAGLIRYRRGNVRILNRDGLIDASCECYFAMSLPTGANGGAAAKFEGMLS